LKPAVFIQKGKILTLIYLNLPLMGVIVFITNCGFVAAGNRSAPYRCRLPSKIFHDYFHIAGKHTGVGWT
jgi:hypothetical protein